MHDQMQLAESEEASPVTLCAGMRFIETELPGFVIIESRVFEDERGCFFETYHRDKFADAGIDLEFVQDNHSVSKYGVLRGLHYQIEHVQAKLVRVIRGEVFDVAVDLRRDSPTLGKWLGVRLSADNRRQVYIPPGFAHGFCALSDPTEIVYKCSDIYHPESERTIAWNDPELAIEWPITDPIVSAKDRNGMRFSEAPLL